MSMTETMELYKKVGTQEKRTINRLLRAMASGRVEKTDLARVFRSVSRACAANRDGPRRISGYILYYQENYAVEKSKSPSSSLGEIAKVIGRSWKRLSEEERTEFNKRANIRNETDTTVTVVD